MRITSGPRQSGKTTRLIMLSAEQGFTIVTPTYRMADCVADMAKCMGVRIPKPIAIGQLMSCGAHSHMMHGRHRVVIDELDMCFRALGLDVVEATMCDEEVVTHAQASGAADGGGNQPGTL